MSVRPGGVWTNQEGNEVQLKRTNCILTEYVHLNGSLTGLEGRMGTESFLRLYTERDLVAEQTPKAVAGQTWYYDRTEYVKVLSVLNGIVTYEYPQVINGVYGYGASPVDRFLADFTLDGPPEVKVGDTWYHERGGAHLVVGIITDGDETVIVHRSTEDDLSKQYIASTRSNFHKWFDVRPPISKGGSR